MTEQVKQDLGEKPIQTLEKTAEKPQKRRSQSDKIGANKYTQQLVKRALVGIEDLKAELRWVRHKLDRLGEADYSSSDVEGFAVLDEVDREILQRVREAGSPGVLPKIVAADVNKRGAWALKYYEVSRRIVRMNKRLRFETGKCLFEKRGHRWALTRWVAFDVDSESEVEVARSNSVSVEEVKEF